MLFSYDFNKAKKPGIINFIKTLFSSTPVRGVWITAKKGYLIIVEAPTGLKLLDYNGCWAFVPTSYGSFAGMFDQRESSICLTPYHPVSWTELRYAPPTGATKLLVAVEPLIMAHSRLTRRFHSWRDDAEGDIKDTRLQQRYSQSLALINRCHPVILKICELVKTDNFDTHIASDALPLAESIESFLSANSY